MGVTGALAEGADADPAARSGASRSAPFALAWVPGWGVVSLVGPASRSRLRVVAQGEAERGRTTIDLFCARLSDLGRPIQTVTVPTTLIPRGSGELHA